MTIKTKISRYLCGSATLKAFDGQGWFALGILNPGKRTSSGDVKVMFIEQMAKSLLTAEIEIEKEGEDEDLAYTEKNLRSVCLRFVPALVHNVDVRLPELLHMAMIVAFSQNAGDADAGFLRRAYRDASQRGVFNFVEET